MEETLLSRVDRYYQTKKHPKFHKCYYIKLEKILGAKLKNTWAGLSPHTNFDDKNILKNTRFS